MLIQFTVKNYKTFRETATLSLVASNYDKITNEVDNVAYLDKFKMRLLKSAVVYGANASGKTKFFEAFNFMRNFVSKSYQNSLNNDEIQVDPFRLNTETENSSSLFEIMCLYNDVIYRYGFEVNKKEVLSEWLYYKPKKIETNLFYREGNDIIFNKSQFPKANVIQKEDMLEKNVLLLSLAASIKDNLAKSMLNMFSEMNILSGINNKGYKGFTISQVDKGEQKDKILNFLRSFDLSIRSIDLEKVNVDELPDNIPDDIRGKIQELIKEKGTGTLISDILTYHRKYGDNKEYIEDVSFSLDEDESSGTNKLFSLAGPLIDKLENGGVLFIDELDSKLHPLLVERIIQLFNSKELNPKNAQLIVNTHNTNILARKILRRDQIWFTDKNRYGEAMLYSLADYKTRKKEAYEENYIQGKYGAIPFLSPLLII